MKRVQFGVFADLHVDIMHDCEKRLASFLEACGKEKDLDFIVQLGDFCYPDEDRECVCRPENRPVNIENALHIPTYANKDKIIRMFDAFEKPSYHVIGNHDCDMCSKKQIFSYYGVEYGSYYSFDMGGFHFIALDGCYMKPGDEYISYENGNYFDESYRTDRVLPYISEAELAWLKEDLAKTPYPSVLFSHQRLCAGRSSILNSEALRKVIKEALNGVLLSVNGHEHLDGLEKVDDTWFFNLNSMSCMWVDTEFMHLGRYTPEIDAKYPNIKYVIPYEEPLYAFVTIDEKGITIKGTKTDFVGETPEEMDLYQKGSPFEGLTVTSEIKDRYLPFD